MKKPTAYYNKTSIGEKGILQLYGYIGEWWDEWDYQGFQDAFRDLEKSYSKIEIQIHSGGGSIIEGLAMYDLIKQSKADVETVNEGLAASMGGILFQAGKVRKMNKNARVMLHRASGGVRGNVNDIRAYAESLESYENSLIEILTETTGKDKSVIHDWIMGGTDKYFNSTESLDNHLADEVLDFVTLENKVLNSFSNELEVFNSFQNKNNASDMKLSIEFINSFNSKFGGSLTGESNENDILSQVQAHFNTKITEKENDVEKWNDIAIDIMVDSHLMRGAITESEVAYYKGNAKEKFEETKQFLNKKESRPDFNKLFDKDGHKPKGGEEDERKDWTYKDWSKNDPDGLGKMMNEDYPKFKALLDAYAVK